jgi:HEPN domain-containing protein
MKRLTAEWVRKAEEDYRVAVRIHRGRDPFHSTVCFHSQQAGEKYLKALMEECGLRVPKTHVLLDLLTSLLPHFGSLRSLRRGLAFLKRFAVEIRYPGDRASKREAAAAVRWAGKIRTEARALLGLPRKGVRRRKKP